MTWIVFQVFLVFGLSLLVVGNPVCLVLLCLISARRDKVCPLYRVRNWSDTNTLQTPQKLSGPLENSCTISPYFFWAEMMRFCLSYSRNMSCIPCKLDCTTSISLILLTFWHADCPKSPPLEISPSDVQIKPFPLLFHLL